MVTGTVKWFDVKKGFGFVINSEGKDVFVHFSHIEGEGFRALRDGEMVEYEPVESDKGLAARNVKRIKIPRPGANGDGKPDEGRQKDEG